MIRLVSILIAFVLDLLIGDPEGYPHPVILIGKMISATERGLRKIFHSPMALKFAGGVLVLFVIFISFTVTWGIIIVSNRIHPFLGLIVESFLIYTTFSIKCLGKEAMKIYSFVKNQDLPKSRVALSYIVGRDTENLDFSEIIRGVVETVAENTVDGFIAPLLYAFIGGAPLAMAYKAVNTMDSMIGYRNDKYIDFGFFAAKLDDVMNFVPARLSVLFFVGGAFLKGKNWKNALYISLRDRKNHKSPNCAFSEGAVAGALGIQLGGSNSYFGQDVYKPTIGDGEKVLDYKDILFAKDIMYTTSFVAMILVSTVYFLCMR